MSSASSTSSAPPPGRRILLVLTQTLQPLNDIVTQVERSLPGCQTEVVDLTVQDPDYDRLLRAIFASDSVQVW
ncbi:MAG: hypothetical protein JNK85_12850 [Verrucomicrobiales bacterium]|nr:hypothetical protein [Verrucomicrobiales bacterium]